MLKQTLKISLLGVSVLALMNANAATTSDTTQNPAQGNFYVTGQLGYAANGLHAGVPSIAGSGMTGLPGASSLPGASGQLSTLGYPSVLAPGNNLANGIAGRLALGYKINQNLGMEVGFLKLHNGSANGSVNVNSGMSLGTNNTLSSSISTSQYAMDIAGKGTLPIAQNFNVYGKVGVAYLTTRTQAKTQMDSAIVSPTASTKTTVASVNTDVTQRNWAPEVAVGVSYDLTSNVSVDASITHIQPVGSKHPGNINFMAVGLGYSFG